jgi:hypothetical protein
VRGRGREDGRRRARLRRGDVEPRGRHGDVGAARALPLPRPAGQAEHGRRRAPPRRLGLRVPAPVLEDAVLRDPEHRQRHRVRELRAVGRLPRRVGLPPQHPPDIFFRCRRVCSALPHARARPRGLGSGPHDHRPARLRPGDDDAARGHDHRRPLPLLLPGRRRRRRPARAALRRGHDRHRRRVFARALRRAGLRRDSGRRVRDRGATRAQARRPRGRGGARARVDGARARARAGRRLHRTGRAHVRGVDEALPSAGPTSSAPSGDLPAGFRYDVPTPEVDLVR